jgi:DNA-binding beta-propeller fold protein YncE
MCAMQATRSLRIQLASAECEGDMSNRVRNLGCPIVAFIVALLVVLSIPGNLLEKPAAAQAKSASAAPKFQVNPLWPMPLPNHWVFGSVTGVAVDAQDHVWVLQRGADSLGGNEKGTILVPPTGCCEPAPLILEFDTAGRLLASWAGSGEGYEHPLSPGGIAVDAKGNVWIAATGEPPPFSGFGPRPATPPAPGDAEVIKFSNVGRVVLKICGKKADSNSKLNKTLAVSVDSAPGEVYVADAGNRRIAVFDASTGAFKREWGAYGDKPEASDLGPYNPSAGPAKQFRGASCVAIAKDDLVYVCDRQGDRIQVFHKDGKYVKEAAVSKTTLGEGSAWDIAFSTDPKQRFLYVADGQDKKVLILDRDSLETVSSFGDGGRYPGHFYAVGSVAADSRGNVYTGEASEGKRVQKFVHRVASAAAQGH